MEDCMNPLGSLDPEGSLLLFYPSYRLAIIKGSGCKENENIGDYSEITLLFLLWPSTLVVEMEYKLAVTILQMINI